MPRLRVHDLASFGNGYAVGPDQDLEHPLGVGGEPLRERVLATRTGRRMTGVAGTDDGLGGGPAGRECVELTSSAAVAHVRFTGAARRG